MSKAYGEIGGTSERQPLATAPWLAQVSSAVASAERVAAGILLLSVFLIVMANVVGRASGTPLIWANELAIYGMAWVALIGASAGLARGDHIAITLLVDRLPLRLRKLLGRAVAVALLAILIVLAIVLWRWFDPLAYVAASSPQDYAMTTFNFMHQEPTTTLGVRKLWFWLALPIFNATAILHISARLFGDAGQ
jgi:TRAP-type C4-dicarboxylate transport system permease small subunit